ncbi:hypothetical protein [Legionella worsleiensis]|uniref:Uncharacterized protein n=1 Tax=Legionella worsleiensis TaxID=45076 RepID=A0A0W1AIV1_9GAMM|nr:hypothetical protein [Legionella worsleiensis]KTD81225.1 hypothetical protein Lwor_0903 [Legionella worsleiensis]STY33202.1 Uncharacterised protein [Legionella worsleiensis]
MNLMLKSISAIALSLSAATAFAVPTYLITHNNTNVESNAFIAGTIPSPYPTPANSTRQVYWNMVKMACYGHTTNGRCSALIKMATNTSAPIELGYVSMELDSGDISPKVLSAKGFTLTVNGPGEATITRN